ncbi:hypothetical protein D9V87_00510 [Bacteroidetes/Chlorobi group bacterium MS-B_bin-24]|jgi:hypothetical protein|nr:MAG: hypothetical protein D9V87_00510 [Bacteroidetes/Chlorobi group bacterium MS-B_bin-24]
MLFSPCTKDIGCFVNIRCLGKSTKFYNQSFVQQWIAEAEKGEQGAVSPCTKDIGCFANIQCLGKSTKFYNQSFIQQWIAEAEKGEQGAV